MRLPGPAAKHHNCGDGKNNPAIEHSTTQSLKQRAPKSSKHRTISEEREVAAMNLVVDPWALQIPPKVQQGINQWSRCLNWQHMPSFFDIHSLCVRNPLYQVINHIGVEKHTIV